MELARSFQIAGEVGAIFAVLSLDELSRLLRRTAELAQSLPNQAELTYATRLKDALIELGPMTTEVERIVKQRIGQDSFRQALLDYWGNACAVTGIEFPALLRASHTKPWADCATDSERLDVYNGFLLTANLDALFDRGFISFESHRGRRAHGGRPKASVSAIVARPFRTMCSAVRFPGALPRAVPDRPFRPSGDSGAVQE